MRASVSSSMLPIRCILCLFLVSFVYKTMNLHYLLEDSSSLFNALPIVPDLLRTPDHCTVTYLPQYLTTMRRNQPLFITKNAALTPIEHGIQYSAISLRELCITNSLKCPVSAETCLTLDSLNLLCRPCLTHQFHGPDIPMPPLFRQRKRWRHRGKRGGTRTGRKISNS